MRRPRSKHALDVGEPEPSRASGRSPRPSSTRETIPRLEVRWRFRLHASVTGFGAITSNPIIRGNTVYLQDSTSSVYALDVESGAVRWKTAFDAPNDGPNGLAISGSRLYGATDTIGVRTRRGDRTTALGASAHRAGSSSSSASRRSSTAAACTSARRASRREAAASCTHSSAATGRIVWRFQTIKHPWLHPESSGGGGVWNAVSVDARGNVYAGIANAGPWGGSKAFPNGLLVRGPCPLHRLAHRARRSHGQASLVRPGDPARRARLRLSRVAGPRDRRRPPCRLRGRQGRPGRRLGPHRPHPDLDAARRHPPSRSRAAARAADARLSRAARRRSDADGLCRGQALRAGRRALLDGKARSPRRARSRGRPRKERESVYALDAATGKTAWQRHLGSAPFGCATVARDAVIVPTYDGRVTAFATADGRTLWQTQLRAGNNSCPAVGKDVLIVAAGAKHPSIAHPVTEVVAYSPER